ncbi:hypothetical protein ACJIZ3_004874 [Penstemon smallii]|uniref:Uncharacterized protein n=1 Tax=Penstemon smallii TaxID=265156 RepID=A0ABD3S395_9LAMI
MNAKKEPKNNLTAYPTTSFSASSDVVSEVDIAIAEGKASITASARSVINDGVQFRAGTRPQLTMPDSRANSLYSISISSRVSMCSLTKLKVKVHVSVTKRHRDREGDREKRRCIYLMGTARRDFTPCWPSSTRTSSVYVVNRLQWKHSLLYFWELAILKLAVPKVAEEIGTSWEGE